MPRDKIRRPARVKLIAEPWDIGYGGYQVGAFPPGWGQWNDKYRDNVRRFWKGDQYQTAELASRLAGSSDVFNYMNRDIWSSVNFITAMTVSAFMMLSALTANIT